MNQPKNKATSAMMKFANMLSGVAAIFAAPYVQQYVHPFTFNYLSNSFDHQLAYWGAWLVVGLLIGSCFYGLSTFFQILIFKGSQPRQRDF
jgi:hypothetical protein